MDVAEIAADWRSTVAEEEDDDDWPCSYCAIRRAWVDVDEVPIEIPGRRADRPQTQRRRLVDVDVDVR